MKDLLQISTTTIGAEQVNSISARNLYDILEVKKAFSTWIKTALDNAGAILDEDYIKLKSSLQGSGYQTDYILTTDMAKHISMMSKVAKSKEIRDYFIQFEKKAKKLLNTQSQEIALMKQMINTLELTDQRVTKIEANMRVENWQQKKLEEVKNKKVYELIQKHGLYGDMEMTRKLHSRTWKCFKNKFSIPRYNELPACEFENGVSYIQRLTFSEII